MKAIREYYQHLDSYLKWLFLILSLICVICFYLSVHWWYNDPFWSNYSSNIAVTSVSFLIAIFIIDHVLKKREERQWEEMEQSIKLRIIRLTTDVLVGIAHTLKISSRTICLRNKEEKERYLYNPRLPEIIKKRDTCIKSCV